MSWSGSLCGLANFNPLPPYGGRPDKGFNAYGDVDISIHSLRMEGDVDILNKQVQEMRFQSTPSVWRETL